MTPLVALSATATVAAALMWPAPAAALHDLPCGPSSETVIDADTGRERCVKLSDDVRTVLRRTRQLQLEQERRTRALAVQQQRRAGGQQRARELETGRQLLEERQSQIEALVLARQRQFNRELTQEALQAPLTLEQSLDRLAIENRVEFDETRRRARLRLNELKRRQGAFEQRLNLPGVELDSELRVRQRQLANQPRQP